MRLAAWVEKLQDDLFCLEIEFHAAKRDQVISSEYRSLLLQRHLDRCHSLGDQYWFLLDSTAVLLPHVLQDLVGFRKPIVAPMLHPIGLARTNFELSAAGSDLSEAFTLKKLSMAERERMVFPVFKISACCLVDARYSKWLRFDPSDASLALAARKHGIAQYVTNRRFYGVTIGPGILSEAAIAAALDNLRSSNLSEAPNQLLDHV
jgi:hypothetical protein